MKKLKTNFSAGMNQAFGDLSVWVIRAIIGAILFLVCFFVKSEFVSKEDLSQFQKDKEIVESARFSDLTSRLASISVQLSQLTTDNAVRGTVIDVLMKQVQKHDDQIRQLEERQSYMRAQRNPQNSTTP